MIKNTALLFLLIFSVGLFAQTNPISNIKKLYEDYEYEKVIQLSESFLSDNQLTDSLKVELLFMRAVSFYAIGNEEMAKKSFLNLFEINKNFSPELSTLPPKIVTLFGDVKQGFQKSIETAENSPENIARVIELSEAKNELIKSSMAKNVLMPGWGQVSMGSTVKGITLMSVATASLGAMVYYIIDTNKKQDEYINETNKLLINQKYSAFNNSYKSRNIFIALFAATWIYSQLDLLFVGDYPNISPQNLPKVSSLTYSNWNLAISIPF